MKLTADKPLTRIALSNGISTFQELKVYLQKLPYGRTSNNTNLQLVFEEMKGTCSSKHALLKQMASENNIKDVQLILCMFKMSESNTPGVGRVLKDYELDYIPEAHCYINHRGNKIDITNQSSTFNNIEKDILEETEIQAGQIGDYKVQYHKHFLKSWIARKNLAYSLGEIWNIREACIKSLSQ